MSNLPASPVPGAVAHPDADNPTGADSLERAGMEHRDASTCSSATGGGAGAPATSAGFARAPRSRLSGGGPSTQPQSGGIWIVFRRRGPASNKGTIDWEIPPHSQGRFEGDPADYVFAEAITTDDVLIHVLLSVIAVDPA